jgi:hypothetical protein
MGVQAPTQLKPDQFAEISDKILLRPEISRSELFKIMPVKGVKLHEALRGPCG